MRTIATWTVLTTMAMIATATAHPARAADCAALLHTKLPDTTLTIAQAAPSGRFTPPYGRAVDKIPAFCRLAGVIRPSSDSYIRFEVWLPIEGWNGKFLSVGNGGFAGSINYSGMAGDLRRGYATAGTDTGHEADAEDASWAFHHPEKVIDFGYRALHATSLNAKSLMQAFYTRSPRYSYFDSCSDGGREGLMEAQRFPEDFDGILAGAPALDQTGSMLSRAWWMQGLAEAPLPALKLKLLADRIYEQCDAKDGLKDGLIDDPRKCGFRASRDLPRCAAGVDQPDCFTTGQIAGLERIYTDVESQGKRFFPGWPVGSEVSGPNGQSGWIGQVVNGPNGPGTWPRYAETFLRYEAFPEKDAQLPLSRFDIDKDPPRTNLAAQILNATDTDLRAFENHGGKLLMYFGWADPQLNPLMGVEYYEKVVEKMGGTTPDFFRLYMVPGMFHCGGGIGTSVFDAATPLLKWVESGTAPDEIPASRVEDRKVARTRPLCPYPQVARYKGSGSIDDAANFSCARP